MTDSPNGTIPQNPYRPLAWTDAVLDIQELLQDYPDPVYIVGGAVRDALMNRPIKDIDLATPGDSIGIARKIANSFPNGALYIMDKERGVARALIESVHGSIHVDVAQFRGGSSDLLDDLTDRDFTINAMMVDLRGDLSLLIDPLMGQRDVADKLIRRCSPESVASDPIRALRAIRQSTQLTFRIEPQTLKDVRVAITHLDDVSEERVRDELFKILSLPRPAAALRVMATLKVIDDVLPLSSVMSADEIDQVFATLDKMAYLLAGFIPFGRDNLATDFGFGIAITQLTRVRTQLEAHIASMWASDRSHRSLIMLMILLQGFAPDDSGVGALAERLRLSNAEKKRLVMTVAGQQDVHTLPDTSPLSLHRFWYTLGEAGVDVCLFTMADYLAAKGVHLEHDSWLTLVERVKIVLEAYYLQHDEIVSPPPVIDGNGLMTKLGLQPGKHIGDLLTHIREAQVTGEVTTEDDALNLALNLLNK